MFEELGQGKGIRKTEGIARLVGGMWDWRLYSGWISLVAPCVVFLHVWAHGSEPSGGF